MFSKDWFTLENKTMLLLGIFVAALTTANLLGSKITTLFGIRVSVGIFAFPILFLITDIIAEVHGKKQAKKFVYIGLATQIMLFILLAISIFAPPNETWDNQDAYESIFSVSLRMIIASIIAFFFSQLHDVFAFEYWKAKTKGKYLWFRNNASTVVSQFIDSMLFMYIAFYMITPNFTVGFIFTLVIPYWIIKIIFAFCDTPFVYLGARLLRGKSHSN
ncbi:queuosine precursor transporter [Candidatus Aenigmatarchaeota archaeon]